MRTRAAAVVLLSPALPSAGADVPGASYTTLEPVVVTVRKRAEDPRGVPVSLAVVEAETVRRRAVSSIGALADSLPNVAFPSVFGRTADRPGIRGITNLTGERAVGLYVDGIYVPGTLSSVGFADLERIEVARGPQTTLYGRSTLAGAINYVTRRPTPVPTGRFSASFGTYRHVDLDAYAAGPFDASATWRGSLSARRYSTAGSYVNYGPDGGRGGAEASTALTASLAHVPDAATDLRLRVAWSEDDDGIWSSRTYVVRNCYVDTVAQPAPGGTYCGRAPAIANGGIETDLDPGGVADAGLEKRARSVMLDLNRRVGNVDVTALAAWSDEQTAWVFDDARVNASGGPFRYDGSQPGGLSVFARRWLARSAELRAASRADGLRWMAGLAHYDEARDTTTGAGRLSGGMLIWPAPSPRTFVDSTAVFGQIEHALTTTVTAVVEGRWTRERLESGRSDVPAVSLRGVVPRVSVTWDPSGPAFAYATWGRGTRPGDLNLPLYAPTVPAAERERLARYAAVDEERADTTELGVRHRRGPVALEFAAFHTAWMRQQVSTAFGYVTTDGRPGTLMLAANSGRSRIVGFEATATWRTASTVLAASYGLAHGTYREHCDVLQGALTGQCSVAGRQVAGAPRHGAALSIEQSHRITGPWWSVAGLQYVYQGSRFDGPGNLAWTGASHRVDAQWEFATERLRVAFWARNLTDDRTPSALTTVADLDAGLPTRRALQVRYPAGRTLGVTLGLRY